MTAVRICIMLIVAVLSLLSAMAEGNILIYPKEPPRFIEEEFRDMPAQFGNSLPPEGLRAMLVLSLPNDGCSAIKPPPILPNFTGKWVVLIARYNCSFEIKVRNAENAGFDGVIVHNVNSSDLEIMSASNPLGISIPSVFVSEDTGFIIKNNYIYPEEYYVVINGDLPFNINTHLLLPFAIVVGLCLIIMIVFMVVKCTRDRRRARRHRLPNSSLKKIPTCKFAKGDPYDTCAICLDDYVEGDKLRVLPCAHAYHCKCIDPWLTKNRRVCPVCKRKVFASGERTSRGTPQTRGAASARESHSDSDTDDDQAPLVRPRSAPTTQGGTFQQQNVNPFILAMASSRSIARAEILQDRVSPDSGRSRGNLQDRSGQGGGGSMPESSGSNRGGPFLTGVLNLKGENFTHPNRLDNASLNEDRQSLTGGNQVSSSRSSSLQTCAEKEPSRRRRPRRNPNLQQRSSSTQGSDRSDNSTIGSAASAADQSFQGNQSNISNADADSTRHGDVSIDIREELPQDRNQGQIGVAALPNVENLPSNNPDRSSGNDFIV